MLVIIKARSLRSLTFERKPIYVGRGRQMVPKRFCPENFRDAVIVMVGESQIVTRRIEIRHHRRSSSGRHKAPVELQIGKNCRVITVQTFQATIDRVLGERVVGQIQRGQRSDE
tara:strand:+ start:83 stop:424 length:342 start_codon:yes stop_codon:yes gene_type:complete